MNREWWAPLTGVLFVVVLIIGFSIGGEPPEADEPVREIVEHYVDNKDSIIAGALIACAAAALLVFFAATLRRALRTAAGENDVLSAVVLAGATIRATGAAIDSTISFALAEAAEDIDPVAVQALQAYWDNDFLPIALGGMVLLLSAGISIVRHGALPRWLGWIAILLAIISLTPIGFAGFLGSGVWIIVVSVLMAVRARRPAHAGPSTPD